MCEFVSIAWKSLELLKLTKNVALIDIMHSAGANGFTHTQIQMVFKSIIINTRLINQQQET